MNVSELMTRDPVSIGVDHTLNAAVRQMWGHDVGMLPILDEQGRVVGVLTDRDVALACFKAGRPLQEIQISDAMASPVHTAFVDDSVAAVAQKMRDHHVRRLPVVDPTGRLVGVVSVDDLAGAAFSIPLVGVSNALVAKILREVSRPRPTRE